MSLDIDECSTGDHNCTQNQWCVNEPGTFNCECFSGYELVNGVCKGNEIQVLDSHCLAPCYVSPSYYAG